MKNHRAPATAAALSVAAAIALSGCGSPADVGGPAPTEASGRQTTTPPPTLSRVEQERQDRREAEAARAEVSPEPTAPVALAKGDVFDFERGNLGDQGTVAAPVVTITLPKALTKLAAKDGRSPLVTEIVVTGEGARLSPGGERAQASSGVTQEGDITGCLATARYTVVDGGLEQMTAVVPDPDDHSEPSPAERVAGLLTDSRPLFPLEQLTPPRADTGLVRGDAPRGGAYLHPEQDVVTFFPPCAADLDTGAGFAAGADFTVNFPYPTDKDRKSEEEDYKQVRYPLASVSMVVDVDGDVSVTSTRVADYGDYGQDLEGTWVACKGLEQKAALESGCRS